MKRIPIIFLLLLLVGPIIAQINIGIRQKTISGATNNLSIYYVAQSDYSSLPFNLWNSQVFSLRWSTTLGDAVIDGLTNPTGFSFSLDGSATDGSDGFYYQKLSSSSSAIAESIATGDTLEVLLIEVSHPSISTGDFELITSPNTWVDANFGVASVNAAVGGEQFGAFAPAAVLGVALPLELLHFDAVGQTGHIALNWASINEAHFSHFELERSADGRQFEKIAQIPAWGTTGSNYDYQDWKAFPNRWYYYRLKMLDQDGTVTYSPIRSARWTNDQATLFAVFPNPVQDEATVWINSPFEHQTTLSLMDASGKIIREEGLSIQAGMQQFDLILSELPAGFYTLRIGQMDGDREWTAPIIKLEKFN